MTNIQKILTSHFGSLEVDVVKAGQSEPGITRKQLGEMLGYSNPAKAIDKIHERNFNRLSPLSVTVKMTATDGKLYDTRIYGFKGVLEICRYSNQLNAHMVIDWAWETLDKLRKGEGTPNAAFHRLQEQNDQLQDELYLLRQRVNALANGYGSFSLWDVAQQLRKNGLGNGNVNKLVNNMVSNGLLCKDTSIKKRSLYRPFLKDFRAGYFDHELTSNGQPRPVWQSDITVTAKGLDWIIRTFFDLQNNHWHKERPMIRYSRETQRRFADIPPEAGGRITVADYYGNHEEIN